MEEERSRASGTIDWLIKSAPPKEAKIAARMTVFLIPADCTMPSPGVTRKRTVGVRRLQK
jgi:hypothetical protein